VIGRIAAIAVNTFREAVRDRVLYGVIGFAALVVLFSMALAELSLEENRRVVTDIGLATISLFTVVVAVFLGSSLLYKEIEKKTLYVILPRPIRRWEFLVGKYLGIVLTGAVFIATMGALQLWALAIQSGTGSTLVWGGVGLVVAVAVVAAWRVRDRSAVLVPWSAFALAVMAGVGVAGGVDVTLILSSLVLIGTELILLAAVALVFSSFSTPFLTGVFTLGVWLVGRSAQEMAAMRSTAVPESIKGALRGLAHVIPNFHLCVPDRTAMETFAESGGGLGRYVAEVLGYGVLYATVLLVIAALIFRRRDFI
jgi:ABC-type transport system involved in multi-copper enzyme maturation permease subunit